MPNSSDPIDTSPNQKGDDFANHARAYLGRGETRLSTMHRVAGVFVGGAGLLTLIPFFLKDVVTDIIRIITYKPWNISYLSNNITCLAITFFLISTFAISCVALYFLFKELVLFYFTPHEDTSNKIFLPRFSISSISIPTLENQNLNIHKKILELQDEKFLSFLLPNNPNSNLYKNYHTIYGLTSEIVGKDRQEIYDELKKENKIKHKEEYMKACLTAMGMSGLQNRTLLEEVARLEISLCRHANSLRRLVLRYFKSLLLIGLRIILIFFCRHHYQWRN